jgi:cell division protein ZipA
MEASTLRWILIVLGIVLLLAIRMFWSPGKERKPKASRKRQAQTSERREPTLDRSADGEAGEDGGETGGLITEDDVVQNQGELEIGEPGAAASPTPAPSRKPPPPRKPAGPPPDRILSLFLLARDNHSITGAELLQATVSTGLSFGDMNIFHRLHEISEKPVFSMANAAKPGHFERDEWNTFETTGVVLFMTLPAEMDALGTWDSMLAAARRMGEILNADLLDEERHPFSRQKEAQIREEMRAYDRGKAGKG